VGKQILTDAASTMKHVTLECGGKCSLIVCADANIDEVSTCAHHLADCGTYVAMAIYIIVILASRHPDLICATQPAQKRTMQTLRSV